MIISDCRAGVEGGDKSSVRGSMGATQKVGGVS